MKPKFEFNANSTAESDKSGVAVWRYVDVRRGEDVEVIVRQPFETFEAAHGMNALIHAAWRLGEAEGFGNCERGVLRALRDAA